MRTKSDEKRQAILDVAAEVFREAGFERASMSEICTRVGGSKATLYNYFPSKEELFFEVMFLSHGSGIRGHAQGARPDHRRHWRQFEKFRGTFSDPCSAHPKCLRYGA